LEVLDAVGKISGALARRIGRRAGAPPALIAAN
jgi:hypothetical protein